VNAFRRSELQLRHPLFERGVLVLVAVGALWAIWLGIGPPGSAPVVGGAAAADGSSRLVANLDTTGARPHSPAARPRQGRPSAQLRKAGYAVQSSGAGASPVSRTPRTTIPGRIADNQSRRPDTVAASLPPASAETSPLPPAPPAPQSTPDPTPGPTQDAIDAQKNVDGAISALEAGSGAQTAAQNAASAVTNALPQVPTVQP
jgi:hypothetical protein